MDGLHHHSVYTGQVYCYETGMKGILGSTQIECLNRFLQHCVWLNVVSEQKGSWCTKLKYIKNTRVSRYSAGSD